jgi:hypothetical protein
MGFEVVTSVIYFLRCSAIAALSVLPRMFYLSKADVAVFVVEMRDAVLAAGILRTIKASAAHHGSQLSYGKPE